MNKSKPLLNIERIRLVFLSETNIFMYIIKYWTNVILETEKFLNHIFKLHNDARIKHGVPLLERDDKVSKIIDYIYILYK